MRLINYILNYIDIAAPLLTLFFFIRPYKKMAKELHYIFWFVFIQFVTNLIATLIEKILVKPNYPAYVINIVVSFIILSALFYKIENRFLKKLVPVAFIVFIVCTVISLCYGEGIFTYGSIISAMASFLITAYCLVFFYWKLVKDTKLSGLTENAFFWIIIGIFTYYTGSFFIFISYKYLIVKEAGLIGILWRFHNVLLTLFCIYTIYGLTCKNYQRT